MKSWMPFIILCIFASLTALTKEGKKLRKPSSSTSFAQVQICEGTEALGNEGQGVGVSAMINVDYQLTASDKKTCTLAFAYSYEYGNDRGATIGRHQPYNIGVVPVGKNDCTLKEENGEILITVKSLKKEAQVLVKNCKVTTTGF